jgi:hypothetical protein
VTSAGPVYLDSSALMRWALAIGGSTETRDCRGCEVLKELEASGQPLVASPITIAEFTSVLHDAVRTEKPWGAFFELSDADQCTETFMRWLADGAIEIRPLGRRAFEMGMAYVAMVAREGRRMRGWDAIHLYEACRLAREGGVPVTLATSDGDFAKILELFPEFARFVQILDTTV